MVYGETMKSGLAEHVEKEKYEEQTRNVVIIVKEKCWKINQ